MQLTLFHVIKDSLQSPADRKDLSVLAVANRGSFKKVGLHIEQSSVIIEFPPLIPDKAARFPDTPAGIIMTEYPVSRVSLSPFYLRQEAPAVNRQILGNPSSGNLSQRWKKIREIYQIITDSASR